VSVSKAAISAHEIATRFWRDRRGAVAVAVAVLLPVLIGFAGIGIEVGLWFEVQRQNQSATDAAAISAALEYAAQIESGVTTDPAAAAATTANYNLFSTSSPNTLTLYPCYGFTITVGGSCNTSSSSGALPNAVQVVLTQPLNTTFANLVTAIWGPSVNTVNVTTTAIAAFPTSSACILALDPIAAGALLVNNGTLSNPNCWAAANSSSGSALNCNGCTIAGPTNVVGGDAVSNGGQLNGSPNRTYASAIADPYAATLTHAFLSNGMPAPNCNASITQANYRFLSANCIIPGGLPFAGTVTLLPGTYWVTDGSLMLAGMLTCAGCSPGGPGVTIIFTTTQGRMIGTLLPTGPLTIILNAPGPGIGAAYAGLLMVQDTVAGVISTAGGPIGSPSATLSGLLYFPSTSLSFAGNIQTDTSNCLVAVANSLSLLTGSVNLAASGCPTAGLATPPMVLSVFLAV
jgi:Flp pilus assembly protein TadG